MRVGVWQNIKLVEQIDLREWEKKEILKAMHASVVLSEGQSAWPRNRETQEMAFMSHLLRAATQLNVNHNRLDMRLICSVNTPIHCFIKCWTYKGRSNTSALILDRPKSFWPDLLIIEVSTVCLPLTVSLWYAVDLRVWLDAPLSNCSLTHFHFVFNLSGTRTL